MPTRPPRACRIGSCPHPAVSRGYCAEHAKRDAQDRHRFAWVYNDKRWRGKHGLRNQVLHEQPLCELCLAQQRVTLATAVDHVIAHRGDPALAFERSVLRSLCHHCHAQVTAAQTWGRR